MEGRRCPNCQRGILVRRVGVRDYNTGLPQFWCDNCGSVYTRADFSIPANRGQPQRKVTLVGPSGAPLAESQPESAPVETPRIRDVREVAEKDRRASNAPMGSLFVRPYLKLGRSGEREIIAKVVIDPYGEFDSSRPIPLPAGKHFFSVIYSSQNHKDLVKYEDKGFEVKPGGVPTEYKVVFKISQPGAGGRAGSVKIESQDYSGISGAIGRIADEIKGLAGRGGMPEAEHGVRVQVEHVGPDEARGELCPNCYHIHGTNWELEPAELNDEIGRAHV
jgi:hypothetical protein